MKIFCGLKCTVTPHKSLNTSKDIVRCPALSKKSCEHILQLIGEQGVTDVRRINVHRDGILKPTNSFVFTFDSPVLQGIVGIGFILAKVDIYIRNSLRCYKCQVFGHHENKCGRQAICVNCSMPEDCQPGQCQRPVKCANCSYDHSANSKECQQWEKERIILKIKCKNNFLFPEAHKQFEQFHQARTYASAVKPINTNRTQMYTNRRQHHSVYKRKKNYPHKHRRPERKPPSKKYFLFASRSGS